MIKRDDLMVGREEQKEILKAAFKEAFREEFHEIKAKFGGWSLKAIGGAIITAVIVGLLWFILTVNGWEHVTPSKGHSSEQQRR